MPPRLAVNNVARKVARKRGKVIRRALPAGAEPCGQEAKRRRERPRMNTDGKEVSPRGNEAIGRVSRSSINRRAPLDPSVSRSLCLSPQSSTESSSQSSPESIVERLLENSLHRFFHRSSHYLSHRSAHRFFRSLLESSGWCCAHRSSHRSRQRS